MTPPRPPATRLNLLALEDRLVPAGLPDLRLASVDAPSAASPGTAVAVKLSVQNAGSAAAGATAVQVRLSADAVIDGSDRVVATVPVAAVGAGRSAALAASVSLPSDVAYGRYYLGAVVDPANLVAESNESNNARASGQRTEVRGVEVSVTRVSSNPYTRETGANRYVRMAAGGYETYFDTRYGGAPLAWAFNGKSLVKSFPGSGMSVVWDSGQDPTQASANGLEPNPISRGDAPAAGSAYYGRETRVDAGSTRTGDLSYQVTGLAPFFWLSHEAADDAVPTLDAAGAAQAGWVTPYTDPGAFAAEAARSRSAAGVPVFFRGTAARAGGIFMLGNELADPGLPWNRRLAEVREGRVAAKVNVSLAAASPSAFAGLMFGTRVRATGTATMDDAYAAPGYYLNVNRAGQVQLLRSEGGGQAPVWQLTDAKRVDDVRKAVNSAAGVQLEVRSVGAAPGRYQVFANGATLGEYADPSPIMGPNVGLIAVSPGGGTVGFAHRQVFDASTEYTSTYTARPDGTIQADVQLLTAPGVAAPLPLYRATVATFLDPATFGGGQAAVWANDAAGNRVGVNGVLVGLAGNGPAGSLTNGSPIKAIWAGNAAGTLGMYAVPVRMEVDGQPAPDPHFLAQTVGVNGEIILHVNALDPGANQTPRAVRQVRLTVRYAPQADFNRYARG